MRKFFEAFVYFVENGIDPKTAKEFAEKVTGIKAPEGKIEIPKTKGPDEFKMPEAKQDVIEASDNVSGNYATGDTKYNADILAEELARKRGFIKEGQDASDMSQIEYSKLYSEAYQFLSNLNRLNKPVKRTPTPKQLITRRERGDLLFINTKISNPMKNKMVLQGLDGTTESVYSQFRIELEAYKDGLEKNLKFLEANNKGLGGKDLENVRYNMKIIRDLENKVNQLADELIKADKSPEKIYQDFRNVQLQSRFGTTKKELEQQLKKDEGIFQSMDKSMEKIKKLLDEMEDIRSGKAEKDRMAIVKRKYQGKGYGPSEGIYRTLARQFLRDEIESGRIETTPSIYNAMKDGNHPFIDPIKVFRHHYGDDAFDTLEKYIDSNYPEFGSPGMRYPGRFEFRKLGLVPKNKKAPGKTYAHYSLPDEIDAEIEEIDNLILDYQAGKSPFTRTKQELLEAINEQNKKRAQYVKIRNEIAPEDTKVKPGDELLETAEVTPIKQEGIISDVDLNIDRGPKTFKGVELYGDETFDELKYIEENGVHPRDIDPREGFAEGGIISLT
tara:strand:+ start:6 stop:1676 length:1671 start_codon:yes stop_codon:yes gene_type:complete